MAAILDKIVNQRCTNCNRGLVKCWNSKLKQEIHMRGMMN